MLETITGCMAEMWPRPAGDPFLLGWAITLGYALAAVLAFRAARRRGDGRERVFWAGMCVLLVLLTLNKQLDLQSWMTASLRCVARADGWYRERREMQALFVAGLAAALALAMAVIVVWMRRTLRRNWLALAGLAVLAGFVLMRAVSFHHVDRLLSVEILEMKLHRWVEVAGIALVSAGALWRPRRR